MVASEDKSRAVEVVMAEIATKNPRVPIIQETEIAALTAFLCRDAALGITMENSQATDGAPGKTSL